MRETVELVVVPISCLHDEPISISVYGLSPKQDVTLQASMKDIKGVHFMSYAHYRANSEGKVDVEEIESLGGHYEGVFPMGLIGTLLPAPNEYKYTRFFKRDVDRPNVITLTVHNGFLNAESLCSSQKEKPLVAVTHERHYMGPGVQRIRVCYKRVRGSFFLPPGDGPFPGVVDMFGTAGGILEFRAAQLASRGFASLALAFINYEDLPTVLDELNISYFEEAVEYLLQHEKIFSNGVGVVGTSKGADLALAMAAFIPTVLACVCINGFTSPVNNALRVKDQVYPSLPKWSHSRVRMSDDGIISLKHAMEPRAVLEKYGLPIEQGKAAFLFLVGSADTCVNSEYQAQLASQYLSKHNYKYPYEVSSYAGVGHLIEPPYSPHCFASFQNVYMLPVLWGGSTKFHIEGQVKAWEKICEFIWHHLVKNTRVPLGLSKQAYYTRSQL